MAALSKFDEEKVLRSLQRGDIVVLVRDEKLHRSFDWPLMLRQLPNRPLDQITIRKSSDTEDGMFVYCDTEFASFLKIKYEYLTCESIRVINVMRK